MAVNNCGVWRAPSEWPFTKAPTTRDLPDPQLATWSRRLASAGLTRRCGRPADADRSVCGGDRLVGRAAR